MRNSRRLFFVFTLLALVCFPSAPSLAVVASFQGLGFPSGGLSFEPIGVSNDGTIVGGNGFFQVSTSEACRWDNGEFTRLGVLVPDPIWNSSIAFGMSATGDVVVGMSSDDGPYEAFRWEDGTMSGLGYVDEDATESEAWGVSADGFVVVGSCRWISTYEAFRWEDGVMSGLGYLPGGGAQSYAYAASADGSVVVGFSDSSEGTQHAFRWENDEMVGLGDLEGGYFLSRAHDVSYDGSVVVGYSRSSNGFEAFRWEDDVMVGLGDLSGGGFSSRANSISADGSVIVGTGASEPGSQAFIWDSTNGMRSVHDLLTDEYGLDLTGWDLFDGVAISADGMTIVGRGINPDGAPEGWIATIPEPGTVFLVACGASLLGRRRNAVLR
jgi:probable HAF family extracellular repeat protein